MPAQTKFYTLFIRDLSLPVRLGCETAERAIPQEVRVNLEFRFSTQPKSMETDNIKDAICYATISQALKNYCENREFKLIEKLAYDLTAVTKDLIDHNIALSLTVHKVKPPVEGLHGGAHYRIADFP